MGEERKAFMRKTYTVSKLRMWKEHELLVQEKREKQKGGLQWWVLKIFNMQLIKS